MCDRRDLPKEQGFLKSVSPKECVAKSAKLLTQLIDGASFLSFFLMDGVIILCIHRNKLLDTLDKNWNHLRQPRKELKKA